MPVDAPPPESPSEGHAVDALAPLGGEVPFKALRGFNTPDGHRLARQRHRLLPAQVAWFRGDARLLRLAEGVAADAVLDVKELCESIEFHARVRRRLRAPRLADLCCGHGLTGLLFAYMERDVDEVVLVDQRRPASHDRLLAVFDRLAPWVRPKVRFLEQPLRTALRGLAPGTSLVALHACGGRTDDCLRAAVTLHSPVAVVPCCYHRTTPDAPPALLEALDRPLASDVHRTYRLVQAGFTVEWSAIASAITPMNRILIGLPPRATTPGQA